MNELAGIANPFRDTVVIDPWQRSKGDVPEIHAEAFVICRSALEMVRTSGQSTSVLLHGEAGSGKTHLLGRFRAYCSREEAHSLDTLSPEVVFASVKLHTNPSRLWRYLRQSLVDDLLYHSVHGEMPQLQRIVLRRLAEIRGADADLGLWWDWLKDQHPEPDELADILGGLLDRLDGSARIGSDLCEMLVHFLLERHIRHVRSWLRGDPLPDAAYAKLGIARPDEDVDHEDEAREIVFALCRLAGPKIPVVFCFDQIEALQVDANDQAALFAFGKLVMELFQQTNNSLLISCIQSAFLDKLNAGVRDAAQARMGVHQKALNPLTADQAVGLAKARMNSYPELATLRASRSETLWPLDEQKLREQIGPAGLSARRVLSTCAEMFDAFADVEHPTQSLEAFLNDAFESRREAAFQKNQYRDTDAILSQGLPSLLQTADGPWLECSDSPPKDIDMFFQGPDGRVGVSLCNHPDLRKVRHRLKRLPTLIQEKQVEKLVVVRDARLPIRENAKAHQLLKELVEQGAQHLRPSAEMLAALDALRRLLSDAKAGDLANAGNTVGPQSVQEWLVNHMPASLGDFLEEVLAYPGVGEPREKADHLDRLMELLEERALIALEEAASEVGVPAEQLATFVREHAREIGSLDGPPGVLFRLVSDELGVTNDVGVGSLADD